jgi:hypothetical protein
VARFALSAKFTDYTIAVRLSIHPRCLEAVYGKCGIPGACARNAKAFQKTYEADFTTGADAIVTKWIVRKFGGSKAWPFKMASVLAKRWPLSC